MSSRAVHIVSNYKEAKEKLLEKIPVAFLVYDPAASTAGKSSIDASGATKEEKQAEKMIQSTDRTRVFGQVARKMQAEGSFGLLSPNVSKGELAKLFDGSKVPSKGFIARIENDVPIKIFDGELTTPSLSDFVKENHLPMVIELGGHNFRFVGRRGKQLAIGVYDPDDEAKTNKFRQEMKQYAVKGEHKDDYTFGAMDGKKWDKFLSQFSITKENLPELFVLDVPERTFWQESSVAGISNFMKAVKKGEIESRQQEGRKKGPLDDFLQVFVDYMPWSLVVLFALFGAAFYLFLPKDTALRIPPPPKSPQPQHRTSGAELLKQLGLKVVVEDNEVVEMDAVEEEEAKKELPPVEDLEDFKIENAKEENVADEKESKKDK